jgi:hypothetical protein
VTHHNALLSLSISHHVQRKTVTDHGDAVVKGVLDVMVRCLLSIDPFFDDSS